MSYQNYKQIQNDDELISIINQFEFGGIIYGERKMTTETTIKLGWHVIEEPLNVSGCTY